MGHFEILLARAKKSSDSKKLFIAAVSVELRNLLNDILSSIDTLKASGIEILNPN